MTPIARLVVVALVSFSFCSAAHSAPNEGLRAKRAQKAWLDWAKANKIKKSQFALYYAGKPVASFAIGISENTARPLASLSKSITGACIMALIDDGKLRRDQTLADIRKQTGTASFPKNSSQSLTIEQLLTHSTAFKKDITQGQSKKWVSGDKNYIDAVARQVLSEAYKPTKNQIYTYNNANYAILGVIIQAVTKSPYEVACNKILGKNSGIYDLSLSPKFSAISSFGGWQGTAKSFLKFANATYGRSSAIQQNFKTLPHVKIAKGIFYGPGVTVRKNRHKGANVWHFGLMCFENRKLDNGSYFAIIGQSWSMAVIHDRCLQGPAMFNLDGTLVKALFGKL